MAVDAGRINSIYLPPVDAVSGLSCELPVLIGSDAQAVVPSPGSYSPRGEVKTLTVRLKHKADDLGLTDGVGNGRKQAPGDGEGPSLFDDLDSAIVVGDPLDDLDVPPFGKPFELRQDKITDRPRSPMPSPDLRAKTTTTAVNTATSQPPRTVVQGVGNAGLWQRLRNWWNGVPTPAQLDIIRKAMTLDEALAARTGADRLRDVFVFFGIVRGPTSTERFTELYLVENEQLQKMESERRLIANAIAEAFEPALVHSPEANELTPYNDAVMSIAYTLADRLGRSTPETIEATYRLVAQASKDFPVCSANNCDVSKIYKDIYEELCYNAGDTTSIKADFPRARYKVNDTLIDEFDNDGDLGAKRIRNADENLNKTVGKDEYNMNLFIHALESLACSEPQKTVVLSLASQKLLGVVQASAMEQLGPFFLSHVDGNHGTVSYEIGNDGQSIKLTGRYESSWTNADTMEGIVDYVGPRPEGMKEPVTSITLTINRDGIVTLNSVNCFAVK